MTDVVHADTHGAVVVPAEAVTKIPAAVGPRREEMILDICRSTELSVVKLRDAIKRAGLIEHRNGGPRQMSARRPFLPQLRVGADGRTDKGGL